MNTENNQRTLGYQYKFSILLEKVVINIGVPCKLSIFIKRGQQKIKLQNQPMIDPLQKCCYFDEIIDLKTNVYYDSFNQIFWDKKISFTLVIQSQNGNKLAGVANYNLATFLNSKIESAYEVLKLNKCPDQNAKIYIKFDQTQIKELGDIDLISSNSNLVQDSADDFHDITFSSSCNNRSILSENILPILDQNLNNQQDTKQDQNFCTFNENRQNPNVQRIANNTQNTQHVLRQQNHTRNQSYDVHKYEYEQYEINKQKDVRNGLSEKKQYDGNKKINDENALYQIQKNDQNKTVGLNDNQKVFILESYIKTMIQDKDYLKQEVSLLKQTISIKNENLQKTQEECNEFQSRYEQIKNQRDDIKQKLDEMKKETEKIENQVLGKVELMRDDFCKQLYTKQQEINSLTTENQTLNQKVKELISDNKTCSERILKNESIIQEQQEQLEKLKFQSTIINHNNIQQTSQEMNSLQQIIKQQYEAIQRLEYNKKRKDEEISKFACEIKQIKDANNSLSQQNQLFSEQIQKLTQYNESLQNNNEDQFVSFQDKPSQILHQNNQSMNLKSFLSNTYNEFHSCIVQDFEEDLQKCSERQYPSISQQNLSFKQQIEDPQIQQVQKSIFYEVKEENSFEKSMNSYKNSRDEYSMKRQDNKRSQSSIISQDIISQISQQVGKANQKQYINEIDRKRNESDKIIFNQDEELFKILQKYQNIEKQYTDGKMKWAKIDKDNDQLKQQMDILNQKFEKMENQLEESKRGLYDALTLALKSGDQELISKLQKTIKQ